MSETTGMTHRDSEFVDNIGEALDNIAAFAAIASKGLAPVDDGCKRILREVEKAESRLQAWCNGKPLPKDAQPQTVTPAIHDDRELVDNVMLSMGKVLTLCNVIARATEGDEDAGNALLMVKREVADTCERAETWLRQGKQPQAVKATVRDDLALVDTIMLSMGHIEMLCGTIANAVQEDESACSALILLQREARESNDRMQAWWEQRRGEKPQTAKPELPDTPTETALEKLHTDVCDLACLAGMIRQHCGSLPGDNGQEEFTNLLGSVILLERNLTDTMNRVDEIKVNHRIQREQQTA